MEKKTPKFRFMAMSKLMGIIVFLFVCAITLFAMKEMHDTNNYDALPQLIISAFGFASVYAGFYLSMAKVEHVEEEITRREKELAMLQAQNSSQEDISDKKEQVKSLTDKLNEILGEVPQNLL